MPKETIYRDVTFDELEDTPGTGTANVTTLTVNWDEARGVEVVAVYEERDATRKSRDHEIVLGAEPVIGEGRSRWIYSHLQRQQINQMIKALRRARDCVFGADE